MSKKAPLIGFRILKEKYELIPLVTMIGVACGLGISYSIYSLYQKPDVRLNKSTESPPWERVDPTKPQKLFTFRTKYERNEQLEALRKEIGSYKC